MIPNITKITVTGTIQPPKNKNQPPTEKKIVATLWDLEELFKR